MQTTVVVGPILQRSSKWATGESTWGFARQLYLDLKDLFEITYGRVRLISRFSPVHAGHPALITCNKIPLPNLA